MAKSKFKLGKGLAQIVITQEPVFIRSFTSRFNPLTDETEEAALVTRGVVTDNGIIYRQETFPIDELETIHEYAKRRVAFEQFVRELQFKSEEEAYSMNNAQLAAVKKVVAQAKGKEPALDA